MLTSSILADMKNVRHGFFTRQGGYSEGIYASLNCGPGSSDDPRSIVKNRAHVAGRMGVTPTDLITLYQVHSPVAVLVDQLWEQGAAPQADAMVCTRRGIALGILTADCVPVLFAEPDAGVIGAAHAGWKGAVGGILEATVAVMKERNAVVSRIHAVIGPCISQKSYEVDARFRDTFMAQNDANARYFMHGERQGHYQFDLPGYVYTRLENAGVGHVENMAVDTYADEDRFFSYRRATHRKESDYGRQISVIALTSS